MRRALIFLAIGVSVSVSVTACSTHSKEPPQAQYPHSPGDVVASGDRQVTREWRPRVETELIRRQPELQKASPMPLVGLMPVWLTPHRRDNGDLIGGQWLWIPSRPGMGAGPLAAPTAPTLEPVDAKPSETGQTSQHGKTDRPSHLSTRSHAARRSSTAPQVETSPASTVPKQMQAQYDALRRSLGVLSQGEGGP